MMNLSRVNLLYREQLPKVYATQAEEVEWQGGDSFAAAPEPPYNSAVQMPLTSGTKIGPYEVASLLGVGGMGEVYRSRDSKLGREVALKVLPSSVRMDTDRLARFSREAKDLAALTTIRTSPQSTDWKIQAPRTH